MTRLRAFWNGNRHLALALIVLALAVRALVPSGYMVGSGGKGISVYVCDDAGGEAKTVTLPMGKKDGSDHGKDKSDVCAFAGMVAAADVATPLAIAANFVNIEPNEHLSLEVMPGRGLAAPPPHATGPPILT